ncbi:MAG: DUF4136 domain-containing protein [Candidatus Latescibacterota bacterium]|nr:MAG: DUF4136 domain-containing protein [Candidatus Latescibacterota bacterium]
MRTGFVVLLVGLVALVVGCSSISVNQDYDSEADFMAYKTYAWLQQPTTAVGDARAAQQMNTLLDKRIRNAVNAQLSAKGMALLDSDDADLFVAYHTGIQDKVNVTDWGYTYPRHYGGWYGGGSDISVTNYQEGTIIVDLIDTNTKQLVWRGTATGALETNPSPEQIEHNLNNVMEKMFKKYPPQK